MIYFLLGISVTFNMISILILFIYFKTKKILKIFGGEVNNDAIEDKTDFDDFFNVHL